MQHELTPEILERTKRDMQAFLDFCTGPEGQKVARQYEGSCRTPLPATFDWFAEQDRITNARLDGIRLRPVKEDRSE